MPATPSWESIRFARSLGATPTSKQESVVFRGAGHAILRATGAAGLTVAFTFGPYGGFHGHFDKLSFVWYGFGKERAEIYRSQLTSYGRGIQLAMGLKKAPETVVHFLRGNVTIGL